MDLIKFLQDINAKAMNNRLLILKSVILFVVVYLAFMHLPFIIKSLVKYFKT